MASNSDPFANPWQTCESKIVYENPWISVREDQVIRPDGQPGIYGVVDTRIATGVVAMTPDREVYLVGQYRYPTDRYSWEIVEGGADRGEDPLEAAKRELAEEAGLIAQTWRVVSDKIQVSNCISSEFGVVYLATDLTETQPNPDGTEKLQLRRVPLAETLRMVDTGEITDAISIIGLLTTERLLRADDGVVG
jgi:8-oxo-dGTP pyrophosphatase MutT (NUDIX family)